MHISQATRDFIRNCTKDEESYRQLLDHLQAQSSPPADLTQHYGSLFEQSNDAVMILDLEGNHLDVNQRAIEMLGYAHDELMVMSFRDTVHPAQQKHSENILANLLDGVRVPPYERIFKHRDGREVYVELNVELVRNEVGDPQYIQSIMRDISDRKRMEQATQAFLQDITALQQVHLELSAIDNLDDLYHKMIELGHERMGLERVGLFRLSDDGKIMRGTYGTDTKGNIRDESYYVETITDDHWTLPVLVAPNHTRMWENADLFDDHQAIGKGWKVTSALWNGTRSLGYLVCDNVVTGKPPRPYEAELVSILGSTFGHLIERKETEYALRESELHYRSLITYMSEGMVIHDTKGEIISCNPASASILGLTVDELMGRTSFDPRWKTIHEDGSLFSPETHPATLTLATGQPQVNVVMGVHQPTGDITWISINSLPMYDSDSDELSGVLVTFSDITDHKLAQEQRFNLALERERLHLLTTFIRDSAHEFRTPLSGISTNTYLMAHNDKPEKRLHRAEQINRQIDRMTTLVDMLLLIAKLEDQSQLEASPVDMSMTLQSLHDTMRDRYEGKPVATANIPTDLPGIVGDPNYLIAGLTQILDNAYRYTPDDGEVHLSAGVGDSLIWIEVRDTGMGIAPENLGKIFDTFWRLDEAHSTPGLGLGLPIAKKIIELHNGTIDISSKQGDGTTIRITLPSLL